MRIAIHGAGVAGPTLAFWLRHHGHEAVMFERAPAPRTGGYVIDFWGTGYDVAEKMGLLPELEARGYLMKELRMVNADGTTSARLDVDVINELVQGRYLSIARGDLATAIFDATLGVETRFGTEIESLSEDASGVSVRLSDGTEDRFDLVVGADGLHSKIRALTFGDANFEHPMGAHVAAFQLTGYPHRDELTFVTHTAPGRQISRVSLRNDETLVLCVLRDHLVAGEPEGLEASKRLLREVYGDMGWEARELLDAMDEVDDIYIDRVSQIRTPTWSKGRVVLIGDAAACPSLLAGEGTAMAMIEAYVLAGELAVSGGDHRRAFAAYEARVRPYVEKKQKAAPSMLGFFTPKTPMRLWLRDMGVRLAARKPFTSWLMGATIKSDLELPNYTLPKLRAVADPGTANPSRAHP